MKLSDEEQDILAGKFGSLPQQALQHQIKVGDFFGAADFVPVSQAHIMADTESLGEAGVAGWKGSRPLPKASAACGSRPSPIRAARTLPTPPISVKPPGWWTWSAARSRLSSSSASP